MSQDEAIADHLVTRCDETNREWIRRMEDKGMEYYHGDDFKLIQELKSCSFYAVLVTHDAPLVKGGETWVYIEKRTGRVIGKLMFG